MNGLSEELKQKRFKSVITASKLGEIMGGWDKPPRPEPDRNFSELEPLRGYIEPLYLGGQRDFLVRDIKPLFDAFTVNSNLIEATLKVIKWDQSDGIHPPVITYAHNRVREELFYDPDYDDVDTRAMRIGRERELDAIAEMAERTRIQFMHTGDDQLHESRDGVGSTPDGMSYDDSALWECGAEVKSFGPDHHLECWMIKDQDELNKKDFDIFCQCQAGLYAFEIKQWKAGFFNPHSRIEALRFKHIDIEPDSRFVKVMLERVAQAKQIMDERRELIFSKIPDYSIEAAA